MSDVTSKKMSSLEGPVHPTHALRVRLKKMVAVLFCVGNVPHWAMVPAVGGTFWGGLGDPTLWKKYSIGV